MTPAQRAEIVEGLEEIVHNHKATERRSRFGMSAYEEDLTSESISNDILRLARAILVLLPEPTKEDVNP